MAKNNQSLLRKDQRAKHGVTVSMESLSTMESHLSMESLPAWSQFSRMESQQSVSSPWWIRPLSSDASLLLDTPASGSLFAALALESSGKTPKAPPVAKQHGSHQRGGQRRQHSSVSDASQSSSRCSTTSQKSKDITTRGGSHGSNDSARRCYYIFGSPTVTSTAPSEDNVPLPFCRFESL